MAEHFRLDARDDVRPLSLHQHVCQRVVAVGFQTVRLLYELSLVVIALLDPLVCELGNLAHCSLEVLRVQIFSQLRRRLFGGVFGQARG